MTAAMVVPGSHKWPRDREPDPSEAVLVNIPKGAALITVASTWHGLTAVSQPNVSLLAIIGFLTVQWILFSSSSEASAVELCKLMPYAAALVILVLTLVLALRGVRADREGAGAWRSQVAAAWI